MQYIRDIADTTKFLIKPALMVSFAYLAQSLIVTTDIMILGWLGVDALAASGMVIRFYMPFFLLALGLSLPITALGGRAVGEKKPTQVRKTVQQGIWLTVVSGIFFSVVVHISLKPFLVYINQPQHIIDLAYDYGVVFAYSIPMMTFGSALRGFMNVVGRPMPFVWMGFLSVILNFALDYGLVFGTWGLPEMGIQGAAWATIIVNAIYAGGLFYICHTAKPYRRYRIFKIWEPMKFVWVKYIASMGVPMSMRMLSETIIFALYYILMVGFGTQYLAAYQVAYQMDVNAFLIGIGISITMATQIGYEKGRKNTYGMKIISLAGTGLMMALMSLYGLFLYVFDEQIANIFIKGNTAIDIATKSIVVEMLWIFIVYQIFHGLYFGFMTAIDGMGKVVMSSGVFIAVLISVGLGGAFFLRDTSLGAYGIIWAMVLSYTISGFVLLALWAKHIYKYKKEYGYKRNMDMLLPDRNKGMGKDT